MRSISSVRPPVICVKQSIISVRLPAMNGRPIIIVVSASLTERLTTGARQSRRAGVLRRSCARWTGPIPMLPTICAARRGILKDNRRSRLPLRAEAP